MCVCVQAFAYLREEVREFLGQPIRARIKGTSVQRASAAPKKPTYYPPVQNMYNGQQPVSPRLIQGGGEREREREGEGREGGGGGEGERKGKREREREKGRERKEGQRGRGGSVYSICIEAGSKGTHT